MRQRLMHLISLRPNLSGAYAAVAAIIFALIQAGILFFAASVDTVLCIPGDGTGLLEHPGMFSIVVGNSVLPIISYQAKSLTYCLGRKLPCDKSLLVRQHYAKVIIRHAFGIDIFILSLVFFAGVGLSYFINHTVILSNPDQYYAHDTFDSKKHIWSFYVSRPILFFSWVVVIPWFGATLLAHLVAVDALLKYVKQNATTIYYLFHPDRCGGYSFFGWADVWYAFGLAVILTETALLILTHDKVTIGNYLALGGITLSAFLISFFSVYPVLKIMREKETSIKSGTFRRLRKGGRLNLQRSAVLFDLRFIPYTDTAVRLALTSRLLIILPYSFSSWLASLAS